MSQSQGFGGTSAPRVKNHCSTEFDRTHSTVGVSPFKTSSGYTMMGVNEQRSPDGSLGRDEGSIVFLHVLHMISESQRRLLMAFSQKHK